VYGQNTFFILSVAWSGADRGKLKVAKKSYWENNIIKTQQKAEICFAKGKEF